MKKLFLILSACLLMSMAANAQSSRMVTDTIQSKVLGVPRAYTIYLPPSFDTNPDKYYPIVYLLHGMWEKNDIWEREGHLQAVADQLIRSGEIQEMIMVTPDAGGGDPNVYQNGYMNMPGWDYETFFIEEFMPYIEGKYRVKQDRSQRGLTGLSMGGGGCTYYAQHHPDLFCGAYAMSALMEIPEMPDYPGAPKPDVNNPMYKLTRSVIDNSCVKYVSEGDADRHNQLRTVAWFVDCGDDDFLLNCNLDFYRAMQAAQIPCQLRVRDGIHNWEYWNSALYTCLPFLQRCFWQNNQ